MDAIPLIQGGQGNIIQQAAQIRHQPGDLLQILFQTVYHLRSFLNALKRVVNQRLDGLRRVTAFSGQQPHFPGDHRKSAPLLSCMGGFNGSIEGENVGLKRHAVDHRDDPAHL